MDKYNLQETLERFEGVEVEAVYKLTGFYLDPEIQNEPCPFCGGENRYSVKGFGENEAGLSYCRVGHTRPNGVVGKRISWIDFIGLHFELGLADTLKKINDEVSHDVLKEVRTPTPYAGARGKSSTHREDYWKEIWRSDSRSVAGEHPYLDRKGLRHFSDIGFYTVVAKGSVIGWSEQICIMHPYYDNASREPIGCELIAPDGSKQAFGSKGFYYLDEIGQKPIILVEGFASMLATREIVNEMLGTQDLMGPFSYAMSGGKARLETVAKQLVDVYEVPVLILTEQDSIDNMPKSMPYVVCPHGEWGNDPADIWQHNVALAKRELMTLLEAD